MTLLKAVAAEALGTALLLAVVVGSGIMGETLADGNAAIALLGNTLATGAALVVLISIFGPLSGAHFNPLVTVLLGDSRQQYQTSTDDRGRFTVTGLPPGNVRLIAAKPGYVQTYYGAKQPGSVGFGPQSGSQNRDVRQLRSRTSHFARSSGISPKLNPDFANRSRLRASLAAMRGK